MVTLGILRFARDLRIEPITRGETWSVSRISHPRIPIALSSLLTMLLKAIVYNKSRQYAGHTVLIKAEPFDTVFRLKEKIEEQTKIPTDIQHLMFGIDVPDNDRTVQQMNLQDGYTIYSTPTYVEVPSMPNL
uniref:Ubiquitin-like domain-containing protein n=1 Tax=Steinernema glaseri TaxID=37863 RepID=A0A1I7ZJG2_9BILA